MESIYLVAGLGNPGGEYAETRHNVGFMGVERFGAKFGANWGNERKHQARVARIETAGRKVVLCEPQTYMNASGEAVAGLAGFFKVPAERVLVLVDDADLPFGTIRLRAEGSSGGHHGLDSIEQHLGTNRFPRLRIGIGRNDPARREITGYVLGKFSAEQRPTLEKVLERVAGQAECFLAEGVQKAMNQFNGAVEAPATKERM